MRRIPAITTAASLMVLLAAAMACGKDFGSGTEAPGGPQPPGAEPTESGKLASPLDSDVAKKTPTPDAGLSPTATSVPATSTPTSFIAVPGVIKSFDDIPPPRGPNLDPPYLTSNQVQQRIAELAPTYGGIYKEKESRNLVIILDDLEQVDRAIAAVAAYYGPEDITETVLIRASGKYTLAQLTEWYDLAQELVWGVDGVYSSYLAEVEGNIHFGVPTEKTAANGRAALEGSGIPADAVVFDVKSHEMLAEFEVNVNVRSETGVEIELEAPSEVRTGEEITLAVVLVNRGDRTVELSYNGIYPEDVLVFRDGVEVWSKMGRVGVIPQPARISVLAPGESVRFETEWPVIDNDLDPLAPGEYLIAGKMRFGEEGLDHYSPNDVATEPVALIVVAD